MVEKVYDRGWRINNKVEKNVKYWLKDYKLMDTINSYGLDE